MNQSLIDHITITAPSLDAGAKLVEQVLGVSPQQGGEHPKMGTHNLFLHLGDSTFLEIIACNPKAKRPERPRWFALDKINKDTLPQLKTWVVRTENIQSTLKNCSESVGEVISMSRGDTNWLITIPEDGSLPVDGVAPALIQWHDDKHPATKMKNVGLSLIKLEIYHPNPERIVKLLDSIKLKDTVEVLKGIESKMIAFIDTPTGIKALSI